VYEVERIYHGTPSGIDNTVIAHEQPVYFIWGQPPEPLPVGGVLHLLVADSGVPSQTREVVGDVRRRWEAEPARYEALFDRVAEEVEAARRAIAQGDVRALGERMDANHELLREMGVSAPVLDRLVEAARRAGALGPNFPAPAGAATWSRWWTPCGGPRGGGPADGGRCPGLAHRCFSATTKTRRHEVTWFSCLCVFVPLCEPCRNGFF
jgi:hypothetical protein